MNHKKQFRIKHKDVLRLTNMVNDAMDYAFDVHIDEIPDGSYRRKTSTKSIAWAKDFIINSKSPHVTLIERTEFTFPHRPYFEFAISAMANSPEYFLWALMSYDNGIEFAAKYQLEEFQL
jgi:hypothetical protein